jgi:hypothetical protein
MARRDLSKLLDIDPLVRPEVPSGRKNPFRTNL